MQPGPTPADSTAQPALSRIDRWSDGVWQPVRNYADAALAEHALVALRHREPEALFRLVRRTGPDAPQPPGSGPAHAAHLARPVSGPAAPGAGGQVLKRVAGALGLVGLVAVAFVAGYTDWRNGATTPRSAAPSVAAGPAAVEAEPETTPADPGPFAGYWAEDGDACLGGLDGFLAGRQIRRDAGAARALAVATYAVGADGALQVGYRDGGSVSYVVDGDGLRLVRARIAGVVITPQQPRLLRRCPDGRVAGDAAPTVAADSLAEAFRLAVRVGDDLAATLTLAHGLQVTETLPAGPRPLALALAYDRAVVVAKLLAAGADPNVRDDTGRTPLSRAVLAQRLAMVEALLAGGADPRMADADGQRPLDHAVALDDDGLIDLLLAAGR